MNPAAAAAAEDDQEEPWCMPADFLPLPPGFNSAPRGANNNTPAPAATTSTTTITDLRQLSQQEFEDLAQQHNQASGIARDPFDAILDGIPERAQLRPEKKQPESYYLGPQGLRPFGRYAQAWKKLQRGFAGQLDALEPVVKRAKTTTAAAGAAAAAAVDGAKPKHAAKSHKGAANQLTQWTRQQLQPVLSSEQLRWRDKLAAFLCRPVDVPLLAPTAPVLDLQELLSKVRAQGGYARVTASGYWSTLARHLQRDEVFAPLLQAVYQCYLYPLEQDLPFDCRPARALERMSQQAQARADMGARVATYKGVLHSADGAAALLRQLRMAQLRSQRQLLLQAAPQQQDEQQQLASGAGSSKAAAQRQAPKQQQQQQQDEQQQQQPPPGGGTANICRCSLQLLQQAARQPELAVQLLKQHRLHSGLHQPSRQACMQEYRRKLAGSRKRSRAGSPDGWDVYEELGDAELFGADTTSDSSDSSESGSSDDDEADAGEQQEAAAAAGDAPTGSRAAAAAAAAGGRSREPMPSVNTSAAAAGGGDGVQDEAESVGAAVAAAVAPPRRGRGRPPGRGKGRGRGRSSPSRPLSAAAAGSSAGTAGGRQGPGGREAAKAAWPAAADAANADSPVSLSAAADAAWQQVQTDPVVCDAARWLLLSRRAVLSGPPGCKQPVLRLPGGAQEQQQPDQARRRSGTGGRGAAAGANKGGGKAGGTTALAGGVRKSQKKGGLNKRKDPRKRKFPLGTERCGSCHTCLNPNLKKACLVNRAKAEAAAAAAAAAAGRGRGSGGAAAGVRVGPGRPPLQRDSRSGRFVTKASRGGKH